MATRVIYRAVATAALGIALSLLLAETTAARTASCNTAEATQLDPPAAPGNCRSKTKTIRDPRNGDYTYTHVSWRDNSSNEDGFTIEEWRRNQSGQWVLMWSQTVPANSTMAGFDGRDTPDTRFRVKAFNAAGDSAWSNWAR